MRVKRNEMENIANEIVAKCEHIKDIQVTKKILKRVFKENETEYSLLFYDGRLSKMDSYNGRELMEWWADDN